MTKKKKVNWDGNFDDVPLQGKILEDHYQGVTEDHATLITVINACQQ
jgi:hypothetical protein